MNLVNLSLGERWQAWAAEAPDREALTTVHGRHTRCELLHQAQGLAHALKEAGVQAGERVALVLGNSHQAIGAVMACNLLGAVFMPLHPRQPVHKRLQALQHTQPTALLWHAQQVPGWERQAAAAAAALPTLCGQWVAEPAQGTGPRNQEPALPWPLPSAAPFSAAPRKPNALAALMHTSGSTGQPKGVMWNHENIQANLAAMHSILPLSERDVVFCGLPLSFGYGLYQWLQAFTSGARLVLAREFAFPAAVLDTLARERVTVLPVVPTMLAMLLQLRDLSPWNLSALHTITCAGAALAVPMQAKAAKRFPQARILPLYGLTECQRISHLPPPHAAAHAGSVGQGVQGLAWWLEDDAGQRLPATDSEGELVVSGPQVMLGYWGQPEATAEVLRQNPATGLRQLRTGDLFRTDAQGFLHHLGRRDDVVKCRGEKVALREVEEALAELEGVQAVAVKAVPDALWGHALLAYVVPVPGTTLTPKQVLMHSKRRLEQHQVPKWVQFLNHLPTTDTGKILRAALPDPTDDARPSRPPCS
jgi:long-chain acyl-CoA synthetase